MSLMNMQDDTHEETYNLGNDPRGLRPIMRLFAAIGTIFSLFGFIALTCVGYVAPPEPELGRLGRWAFFILFFPSAAWSVWLYREYLREQRKTGMRDEG